MGFDFPSPSVALFVSVTVVSVYAIRTIKGHGTIKLPPGPKGIPLFGNLFQLSATPWKEFAVWQKQYGTSSFYPPYFDDSDIISNSGPLVFLKVGGQGILVLNTHQVATELLDRRGNIYSDRPRMISEYFSHRKVLSIRPIATPSGKRDSG